MFRAVFVSNLIRSCSRVKHPIDRSARSLLSSEMVRLYSTEMEPQLSPDLIKIMDQRLSSIEHEMLFFRGLLTR
ncbi:unnamed protein product [Microthlaspi erraticum]|uniref:Uncharacterized protein n=1 Tax=Microthlaspi erraticum TaxID=1685480 RepID=A0A6D2HJ93_9BRAS|nr:unnamed protein product [Microthlaspi erraticum]